MQEGIADLKIWLDDLAAAGLGRFLDRSDHFWEKIERRMVDCKLPGISREISVLRTPSDSALSDVRIVGSLARLHLAVRGFQRFEHLNPLRQYDLLTYVGLNFKKADILAHEGVTDNWLVLAVQTGQENENLHFQKTYLLGEERSQLAMILDYAWGNAGFETAFEFGTQCRMEVVYYPSQSPVRALVKSRPEKQPELPAPGKRQTNINAMLDSFADGLAGNPWLHDYPILVDNCRLIHENTVKLIDNTGCVLPTTLKENEWLRAISATLDQPSTYFGTWDGQVCSILSILGHEKPIALTYNALT